LKKIIYYILLIVFLMFVIPLTIMGGVGPGIKLPSLIDKITHIIPEQTKEKQLTVKNEDIKIKVFITSKNKVETMPLEEYIRGVLAAEMPASFDIEALKAQAVAARTFALANLKEFGGNGCSKHPEADVCSDVHCQAWISKDERMKNWSAKDAIANWNKLTEAVESTRGMVLTYKGKLANRIKYHSTSGGKTEDSINVFGYKEPYLVSVDSPYEDASPSYESKVTIKRSEFVKKIKELNREVKINEKNLSSEIKIIDRTEGYRVKTIKIGNKTFTGVDIRWAMGLKSANFTVSVDSKYVHFNVKGNGHGVGMSQWGAGEMAKRGKKYDEILKHYYTGVDIKNISDLLQNRNTTN
jgi:stage II sporulation protein D